MAASAIMAKKATLKRPSNHQMCSLLGNVGCKVCGEPAMASRQEKVWGVIKHVPYCPEHF